MHNKPLYKKVCRYLLYEKKKAKIKDDDDDDDLYKIHMYIVHTY